MHNFQKRLAIPTAPVIASDYSVSDSCDVAFALSRHPVIPSNLDDEELWPILPHGITRDMAGDEIASEICQSFALDVVDRWINEEQISEITKKIAQSLNDYPDKKKIIITYPLTADPAASTNHLPQALSLKLKELLNENFPEHEIVIDIDEAATIDDAIHIVTKGKRGNSREFNGSNEEKAKDILGRRISHQNVVAGAVDSNAIYIIADDRVTLGGTIRNIHDYIVEKGGL